MERFIFIKKYWREISFNTLIILVFAIFYGRFGDINVDSFREAYIPSQILSGECLYKDIFTIYAPFSYLFNSLLFAIFGTNLKILYFAGLISTIGIANIFSNTLGFIQQRKREFVQYMSIGMTEANIRKMFSIEALVIAGRPLLITLPLTVVFVGFMITSSYLDPMEFLVEAPILEISLFIVAIFVFVGLAYYFGGRRILKADMVETLRNDTLI